MKKNVYINNKDMGIFEVKIQDNNIFIEDRERTEEMFMSVLLRDSNVIAFVSQKTENILPTGMKISKDDIQEYISFDLTKEEVVRRMSAIMAKG